jgi:alpha-glucosidase
VPSRQNLIRLALSALHKAGPANMLRAAAYPLRRTYYEAKFSSGAGAGSPLRGWMGVIRGLVHKRAEMPFSAQGFTWLGPVVSHRQHHQTLTLHCENAELTVSVLAPDLIRVRCLRTGSPLENGTPQPSHDSYAVAKGESEWALVPYALLEDDQVIEIRTDELSCRVAKHPCRVSFCAADGKRLHSDGEGIGWKGPQVAHSTQLQADESLYGLGEKAFPLERRGRTYTMWNTDPQVYEPGQEPIYLNIPFLLGLRHGLPYGLFYDNTYRSRLDLGHTNADQMLYCAEDGELCYYFFTGRSPAAVLKRFTELTGRMPLPPLWALGYHQSRWSYYPDSRLREIARLFREHRIPCDVLHLDIHYMDGYRCFTWDAQRFPDPAGLIKHLHGQGFKVVAMIDCGIKADPAYGVCAEGTAKGMFCAYPDGILAGGPVWPGESYFPDFTDVQVRQWWGQLYLPLLEQGVDGFWNDMNEPTVMAPQSDTLAGCVQHSWEGRGASHRQAHNIYGMEMARATAEGLQRLRPNERPFVFTRSGWAGVQRFATSWTGDNASTWEHLRLTIPMVASLGVSGLSFTGPDIGGFEGTPEPELLVRWTQLGAFLPFFRNHTAVDSPDQEPWVHGEPYLGFNRSAIELRYRLMPYLYTATWQCAQTGAPIVRPMFWSYAEDPACRDLNDQFLCGDALLVAPVCEPAATSRRAYLPSGEWFDAWTGRICTGPTWIEVSAPLQQVPWFIRAGTILPMWPLTQHVDVTAADRLVLHVYVGEGESWLYEDDGHSTDYQTGAYRVTSFECYQGASDVLDIRCRSQGSYAPTHTRWEWHIHGLRSQPDHVLADGQPVVGAAWSEEDHVLSFTSACGQQVALGTP